MYHFALFPHPDHLPARVCAIGVDLRGGTDEILLTYVVEGAKQVTWPATTVPLRTDGLWQTTCFELFLMFDDDERYVEFNFSPSGAWAAYAFDGYREGMIALDRAVAPQIKRSANQVAVDCSLNGLPRGSLRMALTAVIEEEGGRKSYWSLAHGDGSPDFHNPACFAARLPAPDKP